MQRWIFCFILCLGYTTGEQFFYDMNLPKCCNVNQILALNYTCIFDVNITSLVETRNILPQFPDQNLACVEMLYDERTDERYLIKIDPKGGSSYLLDLNVFPKCCPPNLFYDTVEHRCTASHTATLSEELFKGQLNNGMVIMKIALGSCTSVIVDYELPSVRNVIFDANHGVYVPKLQKSVQYGSYCIDKISNSHRYVVRVCHSNFDPCKKRKYDVGKIRCVRKCCADGEVFHGSPTECYRRFGHGLVLKNDSKIHYPNDPFAIVQGGRCLSYMGTDDDIYHMDVRGYIRLRIEDMPWVFLSPFKSSTYCYEYYENDDSQYIFFCVR